MARHMLVPDQSRIAIVGAGAAGLATFVQLRSAGFHNIVLYEGTSHVGGTWRYSAETDDVHSSMYSSLQANIPSQVMAFSDFPFPHHCSSFPGHVVVAEYLLEYAKAKGVLPHIRFNTHVARIAPSALSRTGSGKQPAGANTLSGTQFSQPENYDAVVICSGHFSEPNPWRPENADAFQGRISHSHVYRTPDRFRGKRVVVLGAGPSGADICLELHQNGVDVLLSHKNAKRGTKFAGLVPEVAPVIRCLSNAGLVLADGNTISDVDELLLCTGYIYTYPFLTEDSGISVSPDGMAVYGLYKQCIVAAHPTLSIVGVVFKVIPFPLFQDQASFIAAFLLGKLPFKITPDSLQVLCEEEAKARDASLPEKSLHCLSDMQWEYRRTLAGWTGRKLPTDSSKEVYNDSRAARAENHLRYRHREYIVFGDGPGQWKVVLDGQDVTGHSEIQELSLYGDFKE